MDAGLTAGSGPGGPGGEGAGAPRRSPRGAGWRRWWPALRVVASGVMLVVLLHWIRLRSLFPVWDHTTLWWLAAGVACTTAAVVLSAVRWHRVLAAMGEQITLGSLVNAYLACQFVSNFLPSTIGGDALRVTRVRGTDEAGPGTPVAFASVVVDRMSGWLVLPLLCLAGLALDPSLLHFGRSSRLALILSLTTLGALGVTVTAAASPRLGGRLTGHTNWLRFMGAIHLGLDRIRRHPWAAVQVIAASLVYQLAMVAAGILAAHALGLNVGAAALLTFVPAVAIVQVLPITIGGLGVREGAFAVFLNPLGVPVDQAVALGLVIYAMHLLPSLLGAPSFAVGRRHRPRGPAGSPDPVARAA